MNFYTVSESAASRGEIAIGYRLFHLKENADRSYGVTMNPDKHETVTFGEKDAIIVLAED